MKVIHKFLLIVTNKFIHCSYGQMYSIKIYEKQLTYKTSLKYLYMLFSCELSGYTSVDLLIVSRLYFKKV